MRRLIRYLTDSKTVIHVTELACCVMAFCYFGLNYVLKYGFGISPTIVSVIPISMLLYKVFLTKYSKKEIWIGSVLFGLGGAGLIFRKDTTVFTNVLVLFALKDIDLNRLIRMLFWSALAGSILVMGCSLMGIGLPIKITKIYRPQDGVVTRYCFGYYHPNPFHVYMVRLMCLFCGAYYQKMDWKGILGLGAFNLLIYQLSDSRTGFICGFLLIALMILYRYGSKLTEKKNWQGLMFLTEVTVVLFGFLTVLLWEKIPAMEPLNQLFTGRIGYSNQAFREIGISFWGRAVGAEYVCDNGMIKMMLQFGIIPTTVYWIGTLGIYGKALREKKDFVVIVILVFTVCSFMESEVIDKVFRNVPMMYMTWLIFPHTNQQRNVEK